MRDLLLNYSKIPEGDLVTHIAKVVCLSPMLINLWERHFR